MIKTYHLLGILHCRKCPCLGGIPHGRVCSMMDDEEEGYIGGWGGNVEWENYFPHWCPLLKCNYKKPSTILSLKLIPNSFYFKK